MFFDKGHSLKVEVQRANPLRYAVNTLKVHIGNNAPRSK